MIALQQLYKDAQVYEKSKCVELFIIKIMFKY